MHILARLWHLLLWSNDNTEPHLHVVRERLQVLIEERWEEIAEHKANAGKKWYSTKVPLRGKPR